MNLRDSRSGWRHTAYLMYRFAFFGMRAVSDTEIGNLPRWFLLLFSLRESLAWFVPVLITRERLHRLEQDAKAGDMAVHRMHLAAQALRPSENRIKALEDEAKILRQTVHKFGGTKAMAEAESRFRSEVCYIVE